MGIFKNIEKIKGVSNLVYKPAFFILINFFFIAFSVAEIEHLSTKELPDYLLKLEKGLIEDVAKLEKLMYERGALYENEAVLSYVNNIGKKISSNIGFDKDIVLNIKIIRDPMVNASALPNGSIYIHTGTLARLENEAQLAFMLGHEISHVINKDSVYIAQDGHTKTVTFKILDIMLAPASVFFGILGDAVQAGFSILYVSTITGYSREKETRADEDSVLWVSAHGYHPSEAEAIIKILLSERDRYQVGPEIYFLMSHPSNESRLGRIKKIVKEKYGEGAEGEEKSEEFLLNMTEIKLYNATLNMEMDRLEHAKDNIRWVLEKFPDNPRVHYLAGEICRLKAEDKDKLKYELNRKEWKKLIEDKEEGALEKEWCEEAEKDYNLALKCEPNYADSYKGLGLLCYYKKNKENALTYLEKYLELNPDAADRRHVRSLIKQISKPAKKEEA